MNTIAVVNILFFEKKAIRFIKFARCSNKKNRSRFVSKVSQ